MTVGTPRHPAAPPTLEELRHVVAGITGAEPASIPADVNLVHLGLDSLGMMRVLNRLRRAGVPLSVAQLVAEPTLAAWHRYACSAAQPPRGEGGDT